MIRKKIAIIDMTLSYHVDRFIYWADESPFSFEELECLMKGYMLNGIYNTLRNNFDIQSFMDPFKDEFWNLGN
ncbi:hypothetical protein JMF89_11000 [Clostridiaceae bacterium UIB06]|nr:hypothetical protein [Clostridiaceae bacterium UIB06]